MCVFSPVRVGVEGRVSGSRGVNLGCREEGRSLTINEEMDPENVRCFADRLCALRGGWPSARGELVETQYTTFIAQLFSAIYDEFPSYKERGGGGSDIGPYDVS